MVVSIILPVYNGLPFLSAAIESLLQQTYTLSEIIIIDDGSTDDSWAVIEQYAAANVKVLRQPNQGLPATLNRGIALAQGDYIARMDQDDLSHPDRIRQQVNFLNHHPDIGLVGTGYEVIDTAGNRLGERQPLTDPAAVLRHLFIGNPFCHGSVMLRRSVIEAGGGYDAKAPVEDYDFWTRLAFQTRMSNLPAPLYTYRVNVSSSMVNTNREVYALETRRLADRLWQVQLPPAFAADQEALDIPAPRPGAYSRSRRQLYNEVGLAVLAEYRQRGYPTRREWWALLQRQAHHPQAALRVLRHLK